MYYKIIIIHIRVVCHSISKYICIVYLFVCVYNIRQFLKLFKYCFYSSTSCDIMIIKWKVFFRCARKTDPFSIPFWTRMDTLIYCRLRLNSAPSKYIVHKGQIINATTGVWVGAIHSIFRYYIFDGLYILIMTIQPQCIYIFLLSYSFHSNIS